MTASVPVPNAAFVIHAVKSWLALTVTFVNAVVQALIIHAKLHAANAAGLQHRGGQAGDGPGEPGRTKEAVVRDVGLADAVHRDASGENGICSVEEPRGGRVVQYGRTGCGARGLQIITGIQGVVGKPQSGDERQRIADT